MTSGFLFSTFKRFAAAAVIGAVIGISYLYLIGKQEQDAVKDVNRELVDSLQASLQHKLNYLSTDLSEILTSAALAKYVNSPTSGSKAELASYFSMFASVSRRYDQIRFLSDKGVEKVRINYANGVSRIVADAGLQDKSDRYYLTETLGLPRFTSFVSDFDLNVEGGKVVLPYKPMIRLSHKIYTADGSFAGVLVLNYLGQPLIDELEIAKAFPGDLSLLDDKGNWIFDEQGTRSWNNQLGDRSTFNLHNPEVWSQLTSDRKSSFDVGDFTYLTGHISYPKEVSSSSLIAGRELHLLISSHKGFNLLGALNTNNLTIYGLYLIMALFASLRWTDSIYKHRAAEAELERDRLDYQAHLEEEIELRTHNLEISRERLELAADELNLGIWDINLDRTELSWNEWMFHIHDLEISDEISFDAWQKLIIEKDRSRFNTELNLALAGAEPLDTQIEICSPTTAHIKTLKIQASRTKLEGRQILLGVLRDITADVLINRELEFAKDEAVQAAVAKSEFLANMSHEIRTPLNAVLGMAYLLEKPNMPEQAQNIGSKITHAGKSLLSILNDILDFSKIEAGKLELAPESFSISALLDNLAVIMNQSAADKTLELIIQPDASLNRVVEADRLRLEQVLINLIGNAIKFTDRGYVLVRVETLASTDDRVRLRFSVKDTGIGMTPDSQSRVLKAFEQADVSINRRFGGTGLGLAISTRILEKFGSKLEISSTAGKGSTFSFDIDLSSGSSNHLSIEKIKDLNVLIADDHDVARDALESIVKSIGWRCEIFNGGLPAYHRALKEDSPDLILLDWDMPDMDGLTVARLIKSEPLRSGSPIIVMVTALGSEAVRNSADSIYVDAVLDKPVTASSLMDVVMSIHKPTTAAKGDESENHLAGLKLLVVDDNEFNRQVAVEIFTGEGAEVFSVDDGHEAVEFLANEDHSIDLVLMDIQMPIMDGYEATRKIRQELKLTDLPIIALTAGAFAQDKEKALQSGMNDFIPKPLDVKRSVALIQRYTQGGLELSPKQPSANAAGQADNRILDLEGALTIWRSEEKLNTYLKKFFDEYKTFVSRFARMSDIEREVHKLKGAAGALGLKRLFTTTSSLLDSLRRGGKPNAQKINEFADVLRATLSHIESRCNIKVVSDDPLDLSIEQQLEIIERAQSLLEDNNPAPILGELVTLKGIVDDVLLSKATDALEAFDFLKAKEQINALKAAVIANNQMGE